LNDLHADLHNKSVNQGLRSTRKQGKIRIE